MEIKLSDYAESLSVEAKKRYISKLSEIFSKADPYIDNDFKYSVLPGVTYEQIYDFLVNSSHSLNSKQNAFKSLDAYRTVCAEGWLSSLEVRERKGGEIVRDDESGIPLNPRCIKVIDHVGSKNPSHVTSGDKSHVKPSQQSGILYKA